MGLMRTYRRYLSPMLSPSYKYVPSCSFRSARAIEKYGVPGGVFMGILSVLRCHPFARGGYDPVR